MNGLRTSGRRLHRFRAAAVVREEAEGANMPFVTERWLGGMLTNYVIAQDTRFKAATSGASIANILAGYGTDEYILDYEA